MTMKEKITCNMRAMMTYPKRKLRRVRYLTCNKEVTSLMRATINKHKELYSQYWEGSEGPPNIQKMMIYSKSGNHD